MRHFFMLSTSMATMMQAREPRRVTRSVRTMPRQFEDAKANVVPSMGDISGATSMAPMMTAGELTAMPPVAITAERTIRHA